MLGVEDQMALAKAIVARRAQPIDDRRVFNTPGAHDGVGRSVSAPIRDRRMPYPARVDPWQGPKAHVTTTQQKSGGASTSRSLRDHDNPYAWQFWWDELRAAAEVYKRRQETNAFGYDDESAVAPGLPPGLFPDPNRVGRRVGGGTPAHSYAQPSRSW